MVRKEYVGLYAHFHHNTYALTLSAMYLGNMCSSFMPNVFFIIIDVLTNEFLFNLFDTTLPKNTFTFPNYVLALNVKQ